MDYQVTKQFGTIEYDMDLALAELTPAPTALTATFADTDSDNFGVPKHDDEFLTGGGSLGYPNNIYNAGQSFVTKEVIDLRPLYSDGMVIDDVRINLQRAFNHPRIIQMYNIDPSADLWETILITTDSYPLEDNLDNIWKLHQSGFRPSINTGQTGLGKAHDVVFAQTRVMSHDQSRAYTGTNYANYGGSTVHYTDFALADEVVRGYPDLISAPQLIIYRFVTSWYYARSPTTLSQTGAIDVQTAKANFFLPPFQITLCQQVL